MEGDWGQGKEVYTRSWPVWIECPLATTQRCLEHKNLKNSIPKCLEILHVP